MFSLSKLSPSITDMIRFDHSHLLVTFHQYTATAKPGVKQALAETICDALEIHAMLEEEIFYPAIRRLEDSPVLQKSEPEHIEMRRLINEIRETKIGDARHDELLHDLMRDVMHHAADEETVLLPQAERLLDKDRLEELGAQMASRRMGLLKPKAGKLVKNTAVGFSGSTTAIVVGLAGALMAARYVSKHTPELGTKH
jgi:hemerythrin superfamily protein